MPRTGTVNVRAQPQEALTRSGGFQPYRPDERSAVAAAAAAAAAGVYPPLDVFSPFNTMPIPAGVCYFGIIFLLKKKTTKNPLKCMQSSTFFSSVFFFLNIHNYFTRT